ncbi:MAG: M20/M25/M40 family metallo-hydrolase [Pseudomonadota bacterium]
MSIRQGFFVAALGAFAVVALLAAVIIVRTVNYGSVAPAYAPVTLPQTPPIDTQRAAEHLGEAIRIQTITRRAIDPVEGEEGPWLALHTWLEETYPAAHAAMTRELIPGGMTLLYTWAGSDPALDPILLMAHQDVVPVVDEAAWDHPPFDGVVADGFVHGRGAVDDKGSLVMLMEAADALAASGFAPRRTVHFLFGHNEEVSGSGARSGVRLLAERGVNPAFALDEGIMGVADNPITNKPVALIGVAEKGYLTVEIVARGTGGHSSMPPPESALVRLSRAVVALEENQMPAHFDWPPLSAFFSEASKDMPFAFRLALANTWAFGGVIRSEMEKTGEANAVLRTTAAPTVAEASPKENILPQSARALINFRVHPLDDADAVVAHVRRVTKDIPGLEITTQRNVINTPGGAAVSATDNRAFATLAAVAAETAPGAPVTPFLVLAATDGRHAEAIAKDVYRYLPMVATAEEIAGIHAANERLSVANVGRMTRGYAALILAMDSED